MRVEITYIEARGVGQYGMLSPASKVVQFADTVQATWRAVQEEGGFWPTNEAFVPKSAIIGLRKSDWKGRI